MTPNQHRRLSRNLALAGFLATMLLSCRGTHREQQLLLDGINFSSGVGLDEEPAGVQRDAYSSKAAVAAPPKSAAKRPRRVTSVTPWLPTYLQGNERIEYVLHARLVSEPVVYEQGVYGKVGSATYYVSTLARIPNWDRLYWVMVKVLSEKYGCFMTAKEQIGHTQTFTCRDGRRIAYWRYRGADWIQFHGRQYDQWGNELIVDDGKIIDRR